MMPDELKWSPITITFPPEDLLLRHYRLPPPLLLGDAGPSPLVGFSSLALAAEKYTAALPSHYGIPALGEKPRGSNRTPPIKRHFF